MVSHTTTGEWQSFETRMRQRRAQRLVLRAQAAMDAGYVEDARICLDEARALAPTLPQLAAIERSLSRSRPVVAAVAEETAAPTEGTEAPTRGGRSVAIAAVLAIVAAVSSAAWFATLADVAPETVGDTSPTVQTSPLSAPVESKPMPAPSAIFAAETSAVPVPPESASPEAARSSSPPELTASPPEPQRQELPTPVAGKTAEPPPIHPIETPARLVDLPVGREPAPAPPSVPSMTTAAVSGSMPVGLLNLPAPPAPVPTALAPVESSQEPAVRSVLNRYAAAYSALDADAAQRVWPGVNRTALARAFAGLASQQISLGDCRIDVAGTSATATCSGRATWAPKIGGGGSHSEARSWSFELARAGTGWEIVSARVQNK